MPLRTRIIFFLVAWAIVLMPFYFWRATWFGRELTDQQTTEYLHDDAKARHIQHALVQVERWTGPLPPIRAYDPPRIERRVHM